MRILLITQWFDPEPTFKGLLFAKELQRRGHDVRVLTGFPNYPGGQLYPGFRIRLFQKEIVEGIPVLRVPLYPSHDGSALRRIANYLSFAFSATVGALVSQRPDVAYVYHPPATVGLPALVLKVLRGVPFVYDIQDLWPDTLAATQMLTRPALLGIVARGMKRVYSGASRIVVLSNGFRNVLIDRGVPARRIRVIPNWADEQQIDLAKASAERATALGFDDTFTVTFAGNLGKGQGLETVLDAAERLRDIPKLRFLFVGGGVEAETLSAEARRRALHNVSFFPRRPISEMGEILGSSDALLVHLRDEPLFSITIPSKTQAYLMSGRPILMGVRGDAAEMVTSAGAGIVFTPGDADNLSEAVMRLKSMSPAERAGIGDSARRYYQEHLALAVGAEAFSSEFELARLSKPHFQMMKRGSDVVLSGIGMIVLGIPIAVVAGIVKAKLGSPVLFRQLRPGKDAEPFEMIKFRTMNDRRDLDGEPLPDRERLTGLGAMLRSTSLDELPSLWNVMRGHMSLVGPRPLLMRYTEFFSEEEQLRLLVRPGITGWAQIHGRNELSWTKRLAMDAWYIRNRTMRLDAKILLQTCTRVFRREGVVVDAESVMKNLDDERREDVSI